MNTPIESLRAKYGAPSIGCYADEANGQTYNDKKVIRMALSHGWNDETAKEADTLLDELGDREDREDDYERLNDYQDSATDFLNDLETRPFMSWGWQDGSFGLWPNVEGAKEDCGYVSRKTANDESNPDDPAYPADDYRGEWLHVSDHGNATLYVREDNGPAYKDREIWSVV